MKSAGGFLERNGERVACAAFAAAFVAYVGLGVAGLSRKSPQPEPELQRHQPAELPALPDAGAVFASGFADYWDDSLRMVWVEPKPAEERAVAVIAPPAPPIPAPPMLLPNPGPDLACTQGLPRWPSLPGGEAAADAAPAQESAQSAAPPAWNNLAAGSSYRIWGRIAVLPRHIDELSGLQAIGLAESAVFIDAADRGEVLEVLEVRPLTTGVPWYRVKHRNTTGWVNGLTLRGFRIEPPR